MHKLTADAAIAPSWRVQTLSNERERATFAAAARERLPIREINHDVEWLEAGRRADADDAIVTLADYAADALVGVLPLRVSTGEIKYTVGNVTLFRKKVREFQLFEAPISTRADRGAAMARAMEGLAEAMPDGAVAFASAVPCESEFHALLNAPGGALGRLFHVLQWGGENWHCKIDWQGTLEGYLASLGADSRRNFKRYSKKLFANEALKPKIERFRSADEIGRFLDDGIKISDKTYQKKLYGLGLARGGATEKRFRFAAERGAFLGHILYLNGEPAAFHYGFVFGETFFVLQMGYDPAVAQHQAGAVLFFHVLEDVERLKLPIKVVDCLPGVTDFKLRTTNRKTRIENFYLFKKGLRGSALYAAVKLVDATTRGLKTLAERFKLSERLRRRVAGRGG
jgi:hypothetical protein